MRVLVTGGNGFVGKALLRALGAEEHDVIAPVRGTETPDVGRVRWLPGFDFASDESLHLALEGVATVVHCAAHAHRTRRVTEFDLQQFEAVNVGLSIRLFRAAAGAGVTQFVFISSIGALRGSSDQPVTEQTSPAPSSAYGRSKLLAEEQLCSEAQASDTALTILRPCLVYGRGNPGNMARLSHLVDTGLPLPFGKIDGTRSLVYIGNLVSGILACIGNEKAYGDDFILCDDAAVGLPELVTSIAAAKGRGVKVIAVPLFVLRLLGWVGDVVARLPGGGFGVDSYSVAQLTSSLICSNRKARDVLDWQPAYSVQEGIRETFGD